MKITHNAHRRLLLSVIQEDRVLRSDCVNHPVRKGKCRLRRRRGRRTARRLCARRLRCAGRGVCWRRCGWRRGFHIMARRRGTRDRLWQRRNRLLGRRGIDSDVLRNWWGLTLSVEDGRAPDGHRGLLMPRQMGDGRLVDTASRVDIHSVGDLVRRLRVFVDLMLCLILTRRGQKQTSVRGESQPPEERRERLVGVEVRIPHTQTGECGLRGRLHGHDSRQRHGRRW